MVRGRRVHAVAVLEQVEGLLGEGQSHERCAFGVELDGADLVALGIAGADVAVAQGRLAVGAAVPGLLAHSLDDLIGQVPAVELGDGAHDAVQQDAAGGLVDVLGGGDQTDASLAEGPVDLHVVGAVAGQAVELVDDDVVNVTGVLEVAEHPLQLGTVSAAGGLAAIDLFQAEVTAESRPCSARVREDDEEQKGLPIGKEERIANIVVS